MNAGGIRLLVAPALAAVLLCLSSCLQHDEGAGTGPVASSRDGVQTLESIDHGGTIPDNIVEVAWEGAATRFWPYTGTDFSGRPQDPINLVFAGEVDAVQIRAALLSLDGDRTGYIPPELQAIPLFSDTWSDALGNVQTGYTEGDDWLGAVVQLQLGSYAPLRFHLRLLESTVPHAAGGHWTLGAAHLDMLIGVTADHQVISWELAEYIVAVDMVRSGLLDPSSLPMPAQTQVINDYPSYEEVPLAIYAGMPQWLKDVCGLSTPAIPTDGKATILHVAGTAPVEAGTIVTSFAMPYAQILPKPFCSAGPLDYISLDGVVDLSKTVTVDKNGNFSYKSTISGQLMATTMDVTQNPPVALAPSFRAIVADEQRGMMSAKRFRVTFDTKRIALRKRGVDKMMTNLKVSSKGENLYKESTQCAAD